MFSASFGRAIRRLSAAAPRPKVFATKDLSKLDWESEQMPRILVTGANGQISTELVPKLRHAVSANNVISTDVRMPTQKDIEAGPFFYLDTGDKNALTKIVAEQRIDYIVHNAALLSVTAEKDPAKAFIVNDIGQRNVLDVASEFGLRLFAPSSIATFGPDAPLDNTPDLCVQRPLTMYGINKVDLELTGEYYQRRYGHRGFEFRSLRLPGVISAKQKPGGGTTDWAIEALRAVVRGDESYTCWMRRDQRMPFLHIDDAVNATKEVLFADGDVLRQSVYNVDAVSISPEILLAEIQKHAPGFTFNYVEDPRQEIAANWPRSLDDSRARADWGWSHRYDVAGIVADMLEKMASYTGEKAPRTSRVFKFGKISSKHAAVSRAAKAKSSEGAAKDDAKVDAAEDDAKGSSSKKSAKKE